MKYSMMQKHSTKNLENLEMFHLFGESLETEGFKISKVDDFYFLLKNDNLNLYIQDKLGSGTYTVNIDKYGNDEQLISTKRVAEVKTLGDLKKAIYNEISKCQKN